MNNYFKLGQEIIKLFPQYKGITTAQRISAEGLRELSSSQPELYRAFSELTEGAKEPVIELMQKAKGNYNVAAFRMQSKDGLMCKGAYSVSGTGKGTVEKIHVEKGNFVTKGHLSTEQLPVTQPETKAVPRSINKTDVKPETKQETGALSKAKAEPQKTQTAAQETSEISSKLVKPVFKDPNDQYIIDRISTYIKKIPNGSKLTKPVNIFGKENPNNIKMLVEKSKDGTAKINLTVVNEEKRAPIPRLELVFDKEGRLKSCFYSSHKHDISQNFKNITFENIGDKSKIKVHRKHQNSLNFSIDKEGEWHAKDEWAPNRIDDYYLDNVIDTKKTFERIILELTKKNVSIL